MFETTPGGSTALIHSPGRRARTQLVLVVAASLCSCAALATGYYLGTRSKPASQLPPLMGSAAATGDTMAVATGPISDDAEGIFFLDFITGDLQCLVYYPRAGGFGAHFATNVNRQLPGGKNSKYLLVTGQASTRGASTNTRPAGSIVYVTDINSGMFAAYTVLWDRTAESTARAQSGPLVYVGGGPIRNFPLVDPGKNQPAAIVDPNNK